MKTFPVAMSLIARYSFDFSSSVKQFNVIAGNSYISGVTILGTPAEIYNYGTQYWLIIIAIISMGFAVSYVYIPVFTTLKVSSSYEVR